VANAILIFDRHSLFQALISTFLRLYEDPDPMQVVDCGSESELAYRITENPGAIVFAGQIPVQSRAVALASEHGCSLVWIAEHRDPYLPLLSRSAIKGIILRTATPERVSDCINAIREGKSWVQPPEYSDETPSPNEQKVRLLSPKERLLTSYLLDGKMNPEIAVRFGTSHQRIKNMVILIYDKLGVCNRYELMKMLLEDPPSCKLLM
jgi:DNA-binding NarL/FixJ family response regulator